MILYNNETGVYMMVVGVYFIAAVSIPDTPAAIEKGEEREKKATHT